MTMIKVFAVGGKTKLDQGSGRGRVITCKCQGAKAKGGGNVNKAK